jgi:hypothetical protein
MLLITTIAHEKRSIGARFIAAGYADVVATVINIPAGAAERRAHSIKRAGATKVFHTGFIAAASPYDSGRRTIVLGLTSRHARPTTIRQPTGAAAGGGRLPTGSRRAAAGGAATICIGAILCINHRSGATVTILYIRFVTLPSTSAVVSGVVRGCATCSVVGTVLCVFHCTGATIA